MRVFRFSNFSRLAAVSLSLLQLLLGAACIGFQVTGIIYDVISTHLGCTGIWGGFFIMFSGVAGFIASKMRTGGTIAFYMLLCALATLIGPAIVVTSTMSVMEQNEACRNGNIDVCPQEKMEVWMILQLVDIGLIILALANYCISCSALVVTCWTLYCDPAGYVHDENIIKKYDDSDGANSMEMKSTVIGDEVIVHGYDDSPSEGSKRISAIIEEELDIPVREPEPLPSQNEHQYENQRAIPVMDNEIIDSSPRDSIARHDEVEEHQPSPRHSAVGDESDHDNDKGDEDDHSDRDELNRHSGPRASGDFSTTIGAANGVPRSSGNYMRTLGDVEINLESDVLPP